jgi:hypothetical protein
MACNYPGNYRCEIRVFLQIQCLYPSFLGLLIAGFQAKVNAFLLFQNCNKLDTQNEQNIFCVSYYLSGKYSHNSDCALGNMDLRTGRNLFGQGAIRTSHSEKSATNQIISFLWSQLLDLELHRLLYFPT